MSLESRLANGEPILYPKEVIALCCFSTLMITIGATSSIWFSGSFSNLPLLVTLEPIWFMYWKAYHRACKSLYIHDLQCLQLDTGSEALLIEEYERDNPWCK